MSESSNEENEAEEKIPDRCDQCRFFHDDFLRCRINPPVLYTRTAPASGAYAAVNESSSGWPSVERRDWCGQFQRKED